MKARFSKRSIIFVALALGLSVLFAISCGGNEQKATGGSTSQPGDTTGVTDTSIKVGTLIPLTGAMAPWGIPISKGEGAYFDWINAKGGIYGRKIIFDAADSAYAGPQASEAAREAVENEGVFLMFGNLGTEVEAAVDQYLTEHNVPDMYILSGSSQFTDPVVKNRFSTMVNYTEEGQIFAKYISQNYAGKKLGILAQNDEYGKEGGQATEDELKNIGAVTDISVEWYDATQTDVTAQMQRLKADGVDVVMFWGGPAQAANMAKTARETLSWDVPMLLNEANAAEITATLAGINNMVGVISTTVGIQAYQTEYPAIVTAKQEMASAAPDLPFDNYSFVGWNIASSLVGLLKQAGPDLTREAFIATAESVCDYMTPFSLVPSSTSPTDHAFVEAEIFVKGTVDNSVNPPVFHWVPFGDAINMEKTTNCTVPTPPPHATEQPGPPLGTESYATPSP